ncbi:MAG: urease accessory protein UreF [Moorea sp. SIO2B7]|nr:urease accessory protein UreF [Moorena sp. SIO2B7]
MLLNLLQLASPTLPVGAYSYSDGLEALVEQGVIDSQKSLEAWLNKELTFGAIRLETAVMLRVYWCVINQDLANLSYWNYWLTATKETSELRKQSWQMGNTLLRLLLNLESSKNPNQIDSSFASLEACNSAVGKSCNYAIAFGIGAANWQIEAENALLGYLHSWANNIISVGVKLIPLGQTTGQKILLQLHHKIALVAEEILAIDDDNLMACSWGLGLASMAHEHQYTRLFRS